MSYTCPYCQYELSIDDEYYYCYNGNCEIGYSFKPGKEEELSWSDSRYFIYNNLHKQTFHMWRGYTDLTEMMKEYFTQQELNFQGKSLQHITTVMAKFEKLLKLKVFW
jgi:hypothetical protein